MPTTDGLTVGTVDDVEGFAALADEWDELVRAMPRPSPFLLHGWLEEWWRYYGGDARLAVHVARRDGRQTAALPLMTRRFGGMEVASFVGAGDSALADLLVLDGDGEAGSAVVQRALGSGHHFADLFGLPGNSRLAAAAGEELALVERTGAPVLDLTPGWEEVYGRKLTSKRRSQHRKRIRDLEQEGRIDVRVAVTYEELARALEDVLRLHELRWSGRRDRSLYGRPRAVEFQHAALRRSAHAGVARISTLALDGRAIACRSYFVLEGSLVGNGIAHDPAYNRFSPGWVLLLATLEAAAAEGVRRVEFLGGDESYKLQLADGLDPLYQGLGLASGIRGRAAVASWRSAILLRRRLRRSDLLRRLYVDGPRALRGAGSSRRR